MAIHASGEGGTASTSASALASRTQDFSSATLARGAVEYCRLQPIMRSDGKSRIGAELLLGGSCCPKLGCEAWRQWYGGLADGLVADLLDDYEQIFINVSSAQIIDPAIYASLLRLPAPRSIVLEWIEDIDVDNLTGGGVVQRLRRLRARGFKLAIDDIGSGMDGIGRAVELRPEYAKLDGKLFQSCRSVPGSNGNAALLKGLTQSLEALGAKVIAEWVESDTDVDLAVGAGIPLLQGQFFPTRIMSCRLQGTEPMTR